MRGIEDRSLDLADVAMDQLEGLRHARDWWKREAANKECWKDAAKVNQGKVEQLKAELARYKREVNNLRGKLAER